MIIVTNVEAQREDGTTGAVIAEVDQPVHPDDVEEPIANVALPVHEDEIEWARLATQAAADAGWRVVGPWQSQGSLAFAPVEPA